MPDKLQQAISLIKSGDKQNGRRLLAEVLRADPGNETAWLWMSSVVANDKRRYDCLRQVLKINPNHQLAKTGLAQLQPKQESQPQPTESPEQLVSPPSKAQLKMAESPWPVADPATVEPKKVSEDVTVSAPEGQPKPVAAASTVSELKDEPIKEPKSVDLTKQAPPAAYEPPRAQLPASMKRPGSVTAICIFYWLNTLLGVIGFISALLLAAGPYLTGSLPVSQIPKEMSEILFVGGMFGLSVIIGLLVIFFAVVGWGLWRLKNWARRAAIIMAAFVVPVGLISFLIAGAGGEFRWPVGLVTHGLVLATLLSKDVKTAFGLASPVPERRTTPAKAPSTVSDVAAGEYRKCSYCLTKNPANATECWHCGRDFDPLR